MTDKSNLSRAYALKSPEDSRRLYAEWAARYDDDFVREHGYLLHLHVAHHFAQGGGTGPVLDVGAGTGVCGAALKDLKITPIDATDISPEMLNVAGRKDIYRDLFTADILAGLPIPDGYYSGVISSGTFTTGHVGPDGLTELLRVTKPGGLIAISINTKHYAHEGFEKKLDAIRDKTAHLTLHEVRIYDETTKGPHRDDTAFVVLMRKI
jgi:predicted TPR repeat methyltransferase